MQVFPTGMAAVGESSNLNIEYAGQTIANLAIAPLGVDGMVSIYTQGGGQLIVDCVRLFRGERRTRDGRYVRVFPEPVARHSVAAFGQTSQRRHRSGASDRASAVFRQAARPRRSCERDGDAGERRRLCASAAVGFTRFGGYSNLNVVDGQTIPNLVVVPIGADGSVTVFSERGTHVIVDVFGYFTNDAVARVDRWTLRRVRARRDSWILATAPMPAGASVTDIAPRGRAGIPAAGVAAVFGNLTATDSTGTGFVQVSPGAGGRPRRWDSGRTSISNGHTKPSPTPRSPTSVPTATCCSTAASPPISSSTSAATSPRPQQQRRRYPPAPCLRRRRDRPRPPRRRHR